jgi:GGDEF domain-containing protein
MERLVMLKRISPFWPYLEAVIFISILALVDFYVFPQSHGFKALPFNLLWIPIFMIAGRYGTAPGVFTGFLCACYYFYAVSIENFYFGEFNFEHYDKLILFCFLFFSAFLGQLYDRVINKYFSLLSDHEDLKEQFANLNVHYKGLEKANDELEKRIVRRQTTLNSLYDMAKNLESLEEDALYKGTTDLIKRFIDAEKCCFYLLNQKGELEPVAFEGYSPEKLAALKFKASNNPVIQKALKTNLPISFKDGFEGQINFPPEEKCLMASSIHLISENKNVGVLTVEEAPFLSLNAGNLRILGVISDWVANALTKSKYVTGLKEKDIDDMESGTYSYKFFHTRLCEESSRFMRHSAPFSLALLKLNDFEKLDKEKKLNLLKVLKEIFSRSIRFHDLICRYKTEGVYGFIFPLADEIEGTFHLKRLMSNIKNYNLRPFEDGKELKTTLAFQTVENETPMKLYRLKPEVAANMLEQHMEELLNNEKVSQ